MKWCLSKNLSGKRELAESWQRQTGFRSQGQWHVTHLKQNEKKKKRQHEDTVIAPVRGSGVTLHTPLGAPRIDNTAGGWGTNRRFHEVCNSRCHAYQISVYTLIILTRMP